MTGEKRIYEARAVDGWVIDFTASDRPLTHAIVRVHDGFRTVGSWYESRTAAENAAPCSSRIRYEIVEVTERETEWTMKDTRFRLPKKRTIPSRRLLTDDQIREAIRLVDAREVPPWVMAYRLGVKADTLENAMYRVRRNDEQAQVESRTITNAE